MRFEASLSTTTGGAAAASSKTVMWIVVGLLAAGAALAVWALARSTPEAPEPGPAVYVDAASVEPDASQEDPVQPAVDVPHLPLSPQGPIGAMSTAPTAAVPLPSASARRPRAGRRIREKTKAPPKAAPGQPDTLAAEMEATNAAKQALATNPREALRLAQKADIAFPNGVFGPEREGIVVLALFGVGSDPRALRLGLQYLERHPKGAYAQRIRAALEK